MLRKGQAPMFYTVNAGARISGAVGQQIYSQPQSLFLKSDLTTLMGKLPASNSTNLLILRGAWSKGMITNMHQGPVKLIYYDCIARRDGDDNAQSAFNTGLSDQSGTTVDGTTLGVTPYKSQYFNQFWRIAKVTTVILDPGATHIHYVKARVNRVIRNEYLGQTPALYLRGLTYYTLVVAHGVPANDATTTTTISTGVVALDAVTVAGYDFTYDANYKQVSSLSANVATSFPTGEHGIEVMDGAVATMSSA